MTDPQPTERSTGRKSRGAPRSCASRWQAIAAALLYRRPAGTARRSRTNGHAVAARAGVPPDRLLLLSQVHGRDRRGRRAASGRCVDAAAGGCASSATIPSAAIVVRVADCAPVLIADRRLGVVAAVHAGWRSTMQRIVIAAVDAAHRGVRVSPRRPCRGHRTSLGSCCGEMGEEVVDAFRDAGHAAHARPLVRAGAEPAAAFRPLAGEPGPARSLGTAAGRHSRQPALHPHPSRASSFATGRRDRARDEWPR